MKRTHATSYSMTTEIFALSVTVCEIIAYKLCNVLDSIFFTQKMKIKDLDESDDYYFLSGEQTLSTCTFMHKLALLRQWRTNGGRTNGRPYTDCN